MKFQASIKYALHILGYLHQNGGCRNATDIADAVGITYLYAIKIMMALRTSGLIISLRGCNGGYLLHRPAEKISVYDVVVATEGVPNILPNTKEDRVVSNEFETTSTRFFLKMQEELNKMMRTMTIAALYGLKESARNAELFNLQEMAGLWEIQDQTEKQLQTL